MKTETMPLPLLADQISGCRLGIFGKHPIEADHLEDFGMSSHSLAAFKQLFYVDAIGQNIGQGRWKQSSNDGLPWAHSMVMIGSEGCLVARCVASQDSRGRKQYPLVFAAHASLAPGKWIAKTIALLRESSDEVLQCDSRESIEVIRKAAMESLSGFLSSSVEPFETGEKTSLAGATDESPERLGLMRVLHGCLHGGPRPKVTCAIAAAEDSILWADWLRAVLPNKGKFLTVLLPDSHPGSVDIVFALPEADAVKGMFLASDAKRTMTAEVDFQLEEGFAAAYSKRTQAWIDGIANPAPEQVGSEKSLLGRLKSIFQKQPQN